MKLASKNSLSLLEKAFDVAIAYELGEGADDDTVLTELGVYAYIAIEGLV